VKLERTTTSRTQSQSARVRQCFLFPLPRVVPHCSGVRVPGHRPGGPRECRGGVALTQRRTPHPSEPRRSANRPAWTGAGAAFSSCACRASTWPRRELKALRPCTSLFVLALLPWLVFVRTPCSGQSHASLAVRRRSPLPSRRRTRLPVPAHHRRPLLLLPLGLLYIALPPPACQTKPSPATGGHNGRQGCATPPAADDAIPGPAAALQPSNTVISSSCRLLRRSSAVAGQEFRRRWGLPAAGLHCRD
jgi:hypothetical protein